MKDNYMKKKKKGFTLIELLAVIVILGIILVITFTTIVNVLDNSKKKAALIRAKAYVKTINDNLSNEKVFGNEIAYGLYSVLPDGQLCRGIVNSWLECDENNKIDLNIKDISPSCGTVTITDKVIKMSNAQFDDFSINYLENGDYELNKQNLCVVPTEISCFTIDGDTITGYNENCSSHVVIPKNSEIKRIGNNAFKNKNIESVAIGNNITFIGESAFEGNKLSGNLIIPSSVTGIGNNAFLGENDNSTNNIISLEFEGALDGSSNLKKIGNGAFAFNKLEGTLIFPSSLTSIGDTTNIPKITKGEASYGDKTHKPREVIGAFEGTQDGGTNKLTNIEFKGNNIGVIGDRSFRYNKLQETLTIPDSVQKIGEYAFFRNNLSGNLVIPENVSKIGRSAFQGSSDGKTNNLTSIEFKGKNIEAIEFGTFAFNNLQGKLTIPDNIIEIGEQAFLGTKTKDDQGLTNQITEIEFNSTIKTIGKQSFLFNKLEGTLTIPASVETIGESAFESDNSKNTNKIENLIFEDSEQNPSKLKIIKTFAFEGNELSGEIKVPNTTIIENCAFANNNKPNIIQNGDKVNPPCVKEDSSSED